MSSKNNKKKKKSQAPKTSAQAQKPKAATEEVDEKNIPVQSLSEMLAFAHEAEADLDKAEENEIDIIVPTKKPEEKAEAKPAEASKAEAKPQQPKTELSLRKLPRQKQNPSSLRLRLSLLKLPRQKSLKQKLSPFRVLPYLRRRLQDKQLPRTLLTETWKTPAVRSSRKKHISSISVRWS